MTLRHLCLPPLFTPPPTPGYSVTVCLMQVFTVPRGTLGIKDLCYMVPDDGIDEAGRHYFAGIYYKFHIVVVTENSSVSYGGETRHIGKLHFMKAKYAKTKTTTTKKRSDH